MNSRIPLILALLALSGAAAAVTPAEFQAALGSGFSANRGEAFYRDTHGGDWSCATCHTDNPATVGSHAVTKKAIKPLAPAANAERFTNPEKIEKWFKRNCNDVLKRPCTPQEKGDFLAFLLTVK
ncbi:MAG: DUF1924 domain-containing protein [Candidatus Nitricoxidivorans perseverans]|uniref:DUF1924 domain-containing protein n=1 Tax=Candidatus Nitricoxidivorans perseverans TaxID=2975601 RepID=A0AA49FMQ6_9PROT|nr:MAG: DUF1924 domain-containing protein [Candidatus Nitricoxidivorans perseverans]